MEESKTTQTQTDAPEVLKESKGETVALFIKSAPRMMGELTQQFITRKGLSERAKIRLQMKAVLDMISVDTELPVKDEPKKAAADSEAYAPRRYTGEGRLVDTPDSRQNENILGGTYS